jgi:hypothetical protein
MIGKIIREVGLFTVDSTFLNIDSDTPRNLES